MRQEKSKGYSNPKLTTSSLTVVDWPSFQSATQDTYRKADLLIFGCVVLDARDIVVEDGDGLAGAVTDRLPAVVHSLMALSDVSCNDESRLCTLKKQQLSVLLWSLNVAKYDTQLT